MYLLEIVRVVASSPLVQGVMGWKLAVTVSPSSMPRIKDTVMTSSVLDDMASCRLLLLWAKTIKICCWIGQTFLSKMHEVFARPQSMKLIPKNLMCTFVHASLFFKTWCFYYIFLCIFSFWGHILCVLLWVAGLLHVSMWCCCLFNTQLECSQTAGSRQFTPTESL